MKKLAAAIALAFVAGAASAGSAIEIQTGSYTGTGLFDNAAAFQTVVENAVTTTSWASSYDNLPISINQGALESTITFDVTTAGQDWTFRAGVDFGKGGAIYLDGTAEQSFANNMWWNGNYNTAGQYFQFTATDLSVGYHTLTLYGLEDCCSGNQQTQFQINNGTFTSFGTNDGLPAIPEAQTFAMLLAGLGLIGTLSRRRKQA